MLLFYSGVFGVSLLLWYDAASLGDWFQSFGRIVFSSEIQDWITQWHSVVSRKNEIQDWITQWRSNYHFTLKTEAIRSSETSVYISLHGVTWQKTVIILILVGRMSHIVRLGASKRCLHVHYELVSSNSWFVFGSCPLRISAGTLAVLSEEILRFPQSPKTSAGVGDPGSAATSSLHVLFNSSPFSYPTVRQWTAINLQRPTINRASIECHLVSAVCLLMLHVTWVILPKTCVGTRLQVGILRPFLWSTTKCDLTISYHQYCLSKTAEIGKDAWQWRWLM